MSARAFHGPVSPVGALLGVVMVSAPYALGLDDGAAYVLWAAGPVLGLLLLAPGPTRQLGTGLVASALTLPLLLLALALLGEVA